MSNVLDFSEESKTLYLVRHGATACTPGYIPGQSDKGLSADGIDEIESLANYFSQLKVDSIFSSPINRAVQTTDILAKALNLSTYFKHSGLVEKKEGEWEGNTYWQLRMDEPKQWEKWSRNPITFAPPAGESVKDFVARVGRALDDIRQNYDKAGSNLLLSTHEGVIRSIIIHALNIPIENFFRLEVPTASVTCLEWSKSHATLKFFSTKTSGFQD
jgi:broad specificity phosphatase PhoE